MNVQSVHAAHTIDFGGASHPPAPPTHGAGEASQDVNTVHAIAPAANVTVFQNAHTPTGSRVDKHA
jgi:hypothetical protein